MNLLLARVFQSRWHFYDVSSFLWLAILNRCWTCQIRSDTSCSLPLCDKAEETNQHIWSHLWFLDKFGILVYHLESSWLQPVAEVRHNHITRLPGWQATQNVV